jgi:uroporphyrinogen decarboxylase
MSDTDSGAAGRPPARPASAAAGGETGGAADGRFLRACRREATDATPVWLMRQAGRYMPEYRALRERHGFLELCRTPELAAEATLQPLRAFDLDAAIVFSDILLPLVPMGLDLEFSDGAGPAIRNPIRSEADVLALRPIEPRDDLGFVLAAIALVKRELAGRLPLIGFAGAPFTLASYAIEGGSSRDFAKTKRLMYGAPRAWHALLAALSATIAGYLVAQVEAGADAVQLFDSWAGCLSPGDYREYALPYSKLVLDAVARRGAPSLHFCADSGGLLEAMKETGGDVIGLDWRVDLAEGWKRVGCDRGVQGNLDPAALLAPRGELERRVRAILDAAGGRPGHIFNLGHGVLPETPADSVRALVEAVHEYSRRGSP